MKRVSIFFMTICLLPIQMKNSNAQDWKPVSGTIMTSWAASVTPDNALQEYPRPQMVRKEWKNLNGLWDFAITIGTNNNPIQVYNRKILVPFCVESALSGIKESIGGSQEMMYRRTFNIPENWKGKRILLHFQAVDYYARVWIDGKFVGEHKGGYEAFQFDITDFLKSDENHEVNLVVWDPSNTGTQPVGKQTLLGLSRGRYTPTSGIWQTVWMEPVEDVSIQGLKILPDVDMGTLTVDVALKGWAYNHQIKVQAFDKGVEIASSETTQGKPVSLKIPNPKLWSPESPYLYDLKISLLQGGKDIDEVESYFAMRKISMSRDAAGFMRINLNNKEIFQIGPLDQGYWPDGILTPPTDEALKFDVEYLKKINCNMDRVHVKVQPDRFYYYCDKLGILIWQDMVSPRSGISRSEVGGAKEWETEWEAIIDQLYNHPSIIQWTVFNESWGQYDTERLTDWAKRKDPSRIVSNASGWTDRNVGDIRDFHDYTFYPSIAWAPVNYPRAMVIGEGGGFDLPLKDHLWTPDLSMPEKIDRAGDISRESVSSSAVFDERYTGWVENISILRNYGLNAVVYTQISDVENEVNGWLTYDRKVSKIPIERLAKIHSILFKASPQVKTDIIPLSRITPQEWQYSFSEPDKDWFKKGNPGKWNTGKAPFGTSQMNIPEVKIRWESSTLFLQKDFTIKTIPSKIGVVIYNSGITNIYINGEFVMQINSMLRQDPELKVSEVMLPEKALSLLKTGTNHIAVRVAFNNTSQLFNAPSRPSGFAVQPLYYFDLGLNEY